MNGGQLRLATDTLTNANTISTAGSTQVQFVEGGSNAFASNITGGGMVHVEQGALQLTGTGNTYSGGTTLEIGTTLVATTSTLSSTNQNITNAGGTLVLDQTTSGNFTGVMSDGAPQGQGSDDFRLFRESRQHRVQRRQRHDHQCAAYTPARRRLKPAH